MGDSNTLPATAIVASENPFHKSGPLWSLEEVEVRRPLHEHELMIKMIATGVCHTDVAATSLPEGTNGVQYPKIVGHEGAGYVQKVGSAVTVAKPGDPVLLSFAHCGECDFCTTGRPSYCVNFAENIAGPTDVFEDMAGPEQGQFYGQSSFSSLSVVRESSVVNVAGLIKDPSELKLFAPLGCGLQTGAGAVTVLGEAKPTDVVVVTGLGGVGLGAVMAAKIAGCRMVIGIDRSSSRLELATSVGATHVLNTVDFSDIPGLRTELAKLTQEHRISMVVDTSGDAVVMTAGMSIIGKRGKYIQVGVPPPDFSMMISMTNFFHNSNMLLSCIMGDAVPREFIPQMIQWYREGKFPIDKLVTFLPIRDFPKALKGVETGEIVKPVLVW